MFFFVSGVFCQLDISETCLRILIKFLKGVGCASSNKRLDFGGVPDADTEI